MEKKISIIIVSYRSNERTIQFVLDEVSKITMTHNIIVVNNGATPESDAELAAALSAPVLPVGCIEQTPSSIVIISNSENSGYARGNNIGAQYAITVFHSEFLLISNNDIRLIQNDVVERMVSKLSSLPKAGIIGPKVVGLKGELQSPEPFVSFWDRNVWMYLCTPFYSPEKKTERFQFKYSEMAQEGYHYKIMGSFFIVRSKDYIDCGMMDENTFLYSEEPILTERMKRIGLEPYYYPEVSVLHDHGATTKNYLKKNKGRDIKFESECYYYRTYIHTPIIQICVGKIFHKLLRLLK